MGVLTRALRNITRRKVRVILVVIALGCSMAIMTAIPAGIMANQAATERISENYNTVLRDMEEEIEEALTLVECSLSSGFGGFRGFGGGPGMMFREERFLNDSVVHVVSSIEGVQDVIPFLEKTEGTLQTRETPRGTFEILVPTYTVVGVPLNATLIDDYRVLPTGITEGRTLVEGDSEVALLSSDNAAYFGVSVGDEVTILGSTFRVVGVYETSDPVGLNKLYMSLEDAQAITNLAGQISKIDVYAEDQPSVEGVVSEITLLYPEFYITTFEEHLSQLERMETLYHGTLENAEAALSQTQSVAFQEIGIAVVATSLIVLFTMLYTVRERIHEIGVLKAIGFSNGNVMRQFMIEGIVMSLLAGGVGVVIGVIGAPVFSSLLLPSLAPAGPAGLEGRRVTVIPGLSLPSNVVVTPDPRLIVLAFSVAVLLGAVGSLYPAWKASRISPMEALRYE